jgi:predicted transcriptional regulator
MESSDLIAHTSEIVAAYVSANTVAPDALAGIIEAVHAKLKALATPAPEAAAPELTPAVSIKRSVTTDHIICLEDGKKLKTLKRHLASRYGMTPDEYRAKWGLARDYPMVAPSYAAKRSELAKAAGLGNLRKAA